jgi:hypothetical protein
VIDKELVDWLITNSSKGYFGNFVDYVQDEVVRGIVSPNQGFFPGCRVLGLGSHPFDNVLGVTGPKGLLVQKGTYLY